MIDVRISPTKLADFIKNTLLKSGVDAVEAPIISKVFTWFNLVGRYPQGVWRLPAYLKRFEAGLIKSPSNPIFEKKSDVIYILDGKDGFGHYLTHLAASKAIEVSEKFGIGMVGVKHSNHFGSAAYYINMIAKENKIGLVTSNSVPHVAPYGGLSPVIGTNPFAFSAPTRSGKSILIDFSTGSSSGSAIMKAKDENKSISEGVVVDKGGKSITKSNAAVGGVVLPFGGHKGAAIGLLAEILSGVITGAAVSHQIASLHKNFSRPQNVGHFILALDISKIMAINFYFERMDYLISIVRAADKMEGIEEILLPGEPQWKYFDEQSKSGIQVDEATMKIIQEMANKYSVELSF